MRPLAEESMRNVTAHATTILGVRRDGAVALGGDGQVTFGDTVMKGRANKVRLMHDGAILSGFAGSTADALTLFEKFEEKLERYPGNLSKAVVELAKDWRTDRYLRRLEALLAAYQATGAPRFRERAEALAPAVFPPVRVGVFVPHSCRSCAGAPEPMEEVTLLALVSRPESSPPPRLRLCT
jgi:hypothetical protein